MHIKGTEKLREKLPSYSGRKIIFISLIAISSITVGALLYVFMNLVRYFFPENEFIILIEPILPILFQMLLLSSGFFLVSTMWSRKVKLLENDHRRAYEIGAIPGCI